MCVYMCVCVYVCVCVCVYIYIYIYIYINLALKNLSAMQETWFDPWVGKNTWRRERQPPPVFLPGELH